MSQAQQLQLKLKLALFLTLTLNKENSIIMKKALCLKDLNDFNRLSEGEITTIGLQFVDRAICELPENNFFQLIPYVSFSQLDVPTGKLNCIVYRRPAKGEGEERLQGSSSVGFGGHIDDVSDLSFTSSDVLEDGTKVYQMSLDDIKNTCMTCARRELTEEVGFDPFNDLQIPTEHINFSLEREQEPDEVGLVHVCVSIKVNLDQQRMQGFFEKAKAQETEIEDLRSLSIDVERFTGSFNVVQAAADMNSQMDKELQMEKWSVLVVNSLLTQLVGFIQAGWSFKSVMDDILAKVAEQAKAPEASNNELIVQEPTESANAQV